MGPRRPGGTLIQRAASGPAPAIVGVAGVLAAALSAWAALTNPFTTSADTVTAIALAIVVVGAAASWRRTAAGDAVSIEASVHPRWWPWLVIGAALLAWELVSFSLGPRLDHPTVSSLYDSASKARPLKGILFFTWLWLGAAFLRR